MHRESVSQLHVDTQRLAVLGLLVLVCVYLVASPVWYPRLAPRMYDNARLLEVGFLILAAAFLVAPSMSSRLCSTWTLFGPARWSITVFVVGGAISAALSSVAQVGVLQVGLVVLLIALSVMIAATVRAQSGEAEKVLAIGVFVGAALMVLKFWIVFLLHFIENRTFSWVSPFLDFANVRFFGQYQAYVLLLVAAIAPLLSLNRFARLSVFLVSASFWSFQFMVGTRAVWVGLVVAVVAVAVFMRTGRLPWLRTQVLAVLAGGAIYLLFSALVLQQPSATPIPVKNSVLERDWNSINERKVMALAAFRLIREHPLAGVGPGQFGFHYQSTTAAHPHNTPLQLLSEYGLIAGTAGIALGVVLVTFALRTVRARSRDNPDPVTASIGGALVMGLTDSLLSGNLTMPHSQVLCAVLAGWLVGRAWGERSIPESDSRPGLRVALVGGVLLAASVTAVLSLEYVDVIREMPSPPGIRVPNFWQYGRFGAW